MKGQHSSLEAGDEVLRRVHHNIAHLDKGAFVCGLGEDVSKHVVGTDTQGCEDAKEDGALHEKGAPLVMASFASHAIFVIDIFVRLVVTKHESGAKYFALVVFERLANKHSVFGRLRAHVSLRVTRAVRDDLGTSGFPRDGAIVVHDDIASGRPNVFAVRAIVHGIQAAVVLEAIGHFEESERNANTPSVCDAQVLGLHEVAKYTERPVIVLLFGRVHKRGEDTDSIGYVETRHG